MPTVSEPPTVSQMPSDGVRQYLEIGTPTSGSGLYLTVNSCAVGEPVFWNVLDATKEQAIVWEGNRLKFQNCDQSLAATPSSCAAGSGLTLNVDNGSQVWSEQFSFGRLFLQNSGCPGLKLHMVGFISGSPAEVTDVGGIFVRFVTL